jgi:hypothetical protein
MIEEDDLLTAECYDGANEEAYRAEEAERMSLIYEQQKVFEDERKQLELVYS